MACAPAFVKTRGSSPLTRGKHSRARLSSLVAGLIPAHAGKTHQPRARHSRPRAHPRSRGENSASRPIASRTMGSSPLTRGKHRISGPDACRRGLIPAHAGKTPAPDGRFDPDRAHPRSRGENPTRPPRRTAWRGSSPLTRGKRVSLPLPLEALGLIPAHAGKTLMVRPIQSVMGAHPRSRGENPDGGKYTAGRSGSSPLTRGKPPDLKTASIAPGLIPAHAGKTSTT